VGSLADGLGDERYSLAFRSGALGAAGAHNRPEQNSFMLDASCNLTQLSKRFLLKFFV
jgi:hypothetical protein